MKKYIGAFLVLTMVCVGAAQAKAVTVDDLLKEITSLKQQVAELQSQVSAQVISALRNPVAPTASVQKSGTVMITDIRQNPNLPGPAIPPAVITKTLSKGTNDAEVKVLQSVLKDAGYLKEEVTGYYGRATEAAVKKFQADRGLEATGSVGPRTRAALIPAPTEVPAPFPVTPLRPSSSTETGCSLGSRFNAFTGKPCLETTSVPTVTPTATKTETSCAASGYQFAGKFGSYGSGNGQFDMPYELDADAQGNIYVPDTHNNVVQKFDANGNFVLKFGSYGSGNGQLDRPYGLGVDASGNVYVADTYNNRIVKFSGTGTHLATFGDTILNHPGAVKFDQSGNMYVTDIDNRRVVKFDANGNMLLTFGSYGTGNGQFSDLRGIAIAPNGNVYVVDNNQANRVQVFNSNGVYLNQFGTAGTGNGQFKNPADLHFDSNGYLYVVEAHGNRVQKFDQSGNYLGQFASFGSGNGQISYPLGMTIDKANNIYISDWKNARIVKFSPCSQIAVTTDSSVSTSANSQYRTSATICNVNSAPSLQVLSPNGGEVFVAGQRTTVSWKSCNIPTNAQIGFVFDFRNPGIPSAQQYTFSVISTNPSTSYTTINDGSELVTIPISAYYSNLGTIQHQGLYQARVIYVEPNGHVIDDTSDGLFTINQPSVGMTTISGH